MKIQDIVALAKAGYKIDEIKELLATPIPDQDEPDQTTQDAQGTDTTDTQTEQDAQGTDTTDTQPTQEQTVDYKALYEESQRKLAIAQQQNVHENVSNNNNINEDDKLADIIGGILS